MNWDRLLNIMGIVLAISTLLAWHRRGFKV